MHEAFWCEHLPNMMKLVITLAIFVVGIYLQGFHIEILIKSNHFHGQQRTYPVKLFTTSNMLIMLESALTSNICILSQMLAMHFLDNILVCLLGVWESMEGLPQLHAMSGIMYYMSPPHTLTEALMNLIHMAASVVGCENVSSRSKQQLGLPAASPAWEYIKQEQTTAGLPAALQHENINGTCK